MSGFIFDTSLSTCEQRELFIRNDFQPTFAALQRGVIRTVMKNINEESLVPLLCDNITQTTFMVMNNDKQSLSCMLFSNPTSDEFEILFFYTLFGGGYVKALDKSLEWAISQGYLKKTLAVREGSVMTGEMAIRITKAFEKIKQATVDANEGGDYGQEPDGDDYPKYNPCMDHSCDD